MNAMHLEGQYDLVLYGLGVMGENFIRNFARKGCRVVGVNRTVSVTERFAREVDQEGSVAEIGTAPTLVEACRALKSPDGAVLAMIKANDPVSQPVGAVDKLFFSGSVAKMPDDTTLNVPPLVELVPPGTVIIDAANSHPRSTRQRCAEFRRRGVAFIGTGVSGGAEGALKGPSIMPGGTRAAYRVVGPTLEKVAAYVDGPCCCYVGDNEAGHFVKNVHNGIEYGIMQAISEVYNALASLLRLEPAEMQPFFAQLASGRHGGYLMEISTEILGMTDAETGRPMLDVILDRAGQKGTGKWTSQIAFDLGVPVPTIAAALQARTMSAFKQQRRAAGRRLKVRRLGRLGPKARERVRAAAADALYGAMIAAYAQGFWLMGEASAADPAENGGGYDFTLQLDEVARIWKGGCIIRSRLLDPIRQAFIEDASLHNIMLARQFSEVLNEPAFQQNWRWWVAYMARLGLPSDAIGASLNYFDTYRTARLPANMIQAQRDRFGEHGFERTDSKDKDCHLPPS
jgi:6-phosphogluconate dehydrogenase